MIASQPTSDTFGLCATNVGVSSEAIGLRAFLKRSFDHYLEPRLNLLVPEIESVVKDEPVVKADTFGAAIRFAYCLPRFGPLPEVSVDPDGEISFDWISPSGDEMFSVSVNNQNQLAYAGWFGEKSRVHGIEQLGQSCPQEIIRGIFKATISNRRNLV